jgi:Fe-S-cluster containining protein
MPAIERFTAKVQEIGFSCTRCGTCCRGADALILVTPDEIRRILHHTGFRREEVAVPFPESVDIGGVSCTFEWALVRRGDACRFLEEGRCTIHPCRPWICRTYPFHLEEEELRVDACPGLGLPVSEERTREIVRDLVLRRDEERAEEERVRRHLRTISRSKGKHVLIDGDGVNVLGE